MTKTVTVSVSAGDHTVRLSPAASTGLPNIDYLDFGLGGGLPGSFQWSSSGILISPKSDATHNIRALKDPSVVYHNGRYHVFATTTNQSGAYSTAWCI
jgi:hypothetical protein